MNYFKQSEIFSSIFILELFKIVYNNFVFALKMHKVTPIQMFLFTILIEVSRVIDINCSRFRFLKGTLMSDTHWALSSELSSVIINRNHQI